MHSYVWFIRKRKVSIESGVSDNADERISICENQQYKQKYVDLISIYNFHLMSVIIKVHTL